MVQGELKGIEIHKPTQSEADLLAMHSKTPNTALANTVLWSNRVQRIMALLPQTWELIGKSVVCPFQSKD